MRRAEGLGFPGSVSSPWVRGATGDSSGSCRIPPAGPSGWKGTGWPVQDRALCPSTAHAPLCLGWSSRGCSAVGLKLLDAHSKVRSPRALVRRFPQRFGTHRGCGSPGLEPDRPRPPPAPIGGALGRPICLWRVCSSCHTPGKLVKALRRYS